MTRPRPTLHIIPVLRWSRGGHQTYRAAQLALVSVLDSLLTEASADGMVCRGVLLDGQTLLLDDYLQLRPESKSDLAAAMLNHQMDLGPWFVPPAEMLVSGEALIRNLAAARRRSISHDLVKTALLAQVTGHIGQMPQILQGFGIESAAISDEHQESVTLWQAPDKSTVILAGLLESSPISPQELVAQAQTLLLTQESLTSGLAVLFPITDQPWSTELAVAISDAQRTTRSMHLTVGSISDHVHHLRSTTDAPPTHYGEYLANRDAQALGLQTSRGWTKQQSHLVETLLLRWAEPFVAWADAVDSRKPHSPLLNFAWESLIECHAPEMIGGTHLDETAQEILLKLRTAEELANGVAQSSLNLLVSKINVGSLIPPDSTTFVVFNASSSPTSDVVQYQTTLLAESTSFEIIDFDGQQTPFQIESSTEPNESGEVAVEMSIVTSEIPAFGYKAFGIRPSASPLPMIQEDNGESIENDCLSISLSPADGTLKLFDKRTGRSFNHLNHFIDGGDAGDLNEYRAPTRDTLIDIATNSPLRIQRIIGNAEQRLETFQIYRIPRSLSDTRDSRLAFAAQFVPISIWTTFRLKKGVPRVDIDVLVSNAALDHRLRVHFPTGVYADHADFDGHFEVVRRSITDTPAVFPQQSFVTVAGGSTGFTLANRGLREVELIPTDDGLEIALTLLRCVGSLNGLSTPEAQCLGDFAFAYSLIPHDSDPLPAWHEAWRFQTSLAAKTLTSTTGTLPPSSSLVSCDNPQFVISSIKWAVAPSVGLIVRGYNLSDDPQSVEIHMGVDAIRAVRTRLDETPLDKPHKLTKQRLSFIAQPHEIVSYLIEFRR